VQFFNQITDYHYTINRCGILVIISKDYLLTLLNAVTDVMYHYE